MGFQHRDILNVGDFTKEDILHLLQKTAQLKAAPRGDMLKDKILGSCFFEPSTRTRLSFEAAILRQGGAVVGFEDVRTTSTAKGESLSDTMKMMAHYCDVVVIRHPLEGSAQLAADAISVPVINAGDGANQHPTQTFLDLFSIYESQGTLEKLHIALVGDLKYGRTVHSLAQALIPFNCRLYFVSPAALEMPQEICNQLRASGIKFSYHLNLAEIMPRLDIVYMTRLQEERFVNKEEFTELKKHYRLTPQVLEHARKSLKILHPLPRVGEIDPQIDSTSHAYYFQQAQNGLYTRQALLALLLGTMEDKP